MATKSRSKFLRIIGSILAFFMLGVSAMSAFDYVVYHEYLTPYFESGNFKSYLDNVFSNIVTYHKEFDKYSSKSNKDKVSDSEIENEKNNNRNQMEMETNDLDNRYDYQINDAINNSNKEKADRLKEEKSKRQEEIKKKYNKSDEEIRNQLVANKDKQYNDLKKSLTEGSEFRYYIINDNNGETYSNLNVDKDIDSYIKNNAMYSIKFPQDIKQDQWYQRINRLMTDSRWHGYFVVPKDLKYYSRIQSDKNLYETRNEILRKEISIGAISLVCGIIFLLISSIGKSKDNNSKGNGKSLYLNIPLDIRIIIFGVITVITGISFIVLNIDIGAQMPFYYKLMSEKNFYSVLLATFELFFVTVNFAGAIKLLKNKEELIYQYKNSIILKIFKYIHKNITNKFLNLIIKSSSGRTLALRVAAALILSIMFGLSITIILNGNSPAFFGISSIVYCIIYLIFVPMYMLKKISSFNKIIVGTQEMTAGNLDFEIKEEGHHELYKLAHNINNIKSGFKKSVEQQMKSERLKSELITNVSHDLKTPLTSIINYIDLLKNKELTKEEMEGYIGVLDRKSQRLKVLIEDLFEASKAASGTVELNIEKLDVVQLLKQTLGEFDEKIKNSSLTFKFNDPKKSIYLNLDGKKTWRAFENLLSNILKYSQSNTRVYIDVIEETEKVKIVMKNISAYEMDFEVDEIFERFKRGDQSRHTEGSGLGLAIARSITELQGGKLNIEIDGDLFKATVEFNK